MTPSHDGDRHPGYERGASGRASADEPVVRLAEIPRVVARRKWMILVATLTLFAAASGVLLLLPPRYAAEVVLLIDTRRAQIIDIESILTNPLVAPEEGIVRSEVQILQSEALARAVVEAAGLLDNPEYRQNATGLSAGVASTIQALRNFLARLAHAVGGAERAVAVDGTPQPDLPPGSGGRERSAALAGAVALYMQNVAITNEPRTFLLGIRVRARDPELAARLADTHARLYLERQQEALRSSVARASSTILGHLDGLREATRRAEAAVQDYRQAHQIVRARDGTVVAQQVSEVTTQLTAVRGDLAQAEARSRRLRQVAAGRGDLDATSEVIGSPLIQRLREQEAETLRRLAENQGRYGASHPSQLILTNQVDSIRAQIRSEVQRIREALDGDVMAARAREQTLVDSLRALESRNAVASGAEVHLRDLERQAEASRSVYEVFLARYRQASIQEDLQRPIAQVMAAATVPAYPYFPRMPQHLAVAFALSLLLSLTFAVVRELLRAGVRRSGEIESKLGLPTFRSIPFVRRHWTSRLAPQRMVVDAPHSQFSESIRATREQIRMMDPGGSPRTIVITSALPREGKSVIAVSIARSFAMSGARTVIVDGDLRRPATDRLVAGRSYDRGFADVLAGDMAIDAATIPDPLTPLHFLPAGSPAAASGEAIESLRTKRLLDALRSQYDIVVIDSPPISAVADGLVLASHADATIVVVRWMQTPRAAVTAAVASLLKNGARIFGAVLSQVDTSRQSQFDRDDFEYYARENRAYYLQALPGRRALLRQSRE